MRDFFFPAAIQRYPAKPLGYRAGTVAVLLGAPCLAWMVLSGQMPKFPHDAKVASATRAIKKAPHVVTLNVVPMSAGQMQVRTSAPAEALPSKSQAVPKPAPTATKSAAMVPAVPTPAPAPAKPPAPPLAPKLSPKPKAPSSFVTATAHDGVSLPGISLVGAYDPNMISAWLSHGLAVLELQTNGYGTLIAQMASSGQFQISRPTGPSDPRSELTIDKAIAPATFPLDMAMAQAGFGNAQITSIRVVLSRTAASQVVAATQASENALTVKGASAIKPESLHMLVCLSAQDTSILKVTSSDGQVLANKTVECR